MIKELQHDNVFFFFLNHTVQKRFLTFIKNNFGLPLCINIFLPTGKGEQGTQGGAPIGIRPQGRLRTNKKTYVVHLCDHARSLKSVCIGEREYAAP